MKVLLLMLVSLVTNAQVFDIQYGLQVPGIVVLPANVTNNNGTPDTLEDITDLSFSIENGGTYYFSFFITYTSAANTTGSGWSVNGPTFSSLYFHTRNTSGPSSIEVDEGLIAYNAHGVGASSSTNINIAIIEGTVTATANGILIGRFSSEIAGSAITCLGLHSFVTYTKIN